MNLGKSLLRSHRNSEGSQKQGHKNYSMKHQQTDITEFLETKKYREEDGNWDESLSSLCFPLDELFQSLCKMTKDSQASIYGDASRTSLPILLKIPVRPEWDYEQSKEEVLLRESQYFSKWRGAMRELEKRALPLTCLYEKNIELWRQLWRVTERCDLIIQIVDCRNPNAYRCRDFERNVCAKNKMFVLILNKADLITENQRKFWAKHLQSNKINFVFFSSTASETNSSHIDLGKLKEQPGKMRKSRKETRLKGSIHISSRKITKHDESMIEFRDESAVTTEERVSIDINLLAEHGLLEYIRVSTEKTLSFFNSHDICASSQVRVLLTSLQKMKEALSNFFKTNIVRRDEEQACPIDRHEILKVALVGFPNVGKSSFFNSLLNQKKAATGARPGKTKYFQSMHMPGNPSVVIHDSPGILYPSFSKNMSTALCEGKVCLQSSKNHERHLIEVCKHLTLETLESYYKVKIPHCKKLKVEDYIDVLLTTIAYGRGHVGAFNQPLKSITALRIFRDYVKGYLVYVAPPPLELQEYEELLSIVKSIQGFELWKRHDHMAPHFSKTLNNGKFSASESIRERWDFFIPIETFPVEEQPYLYYELYFNT